MQLALRRDVLLCVSLLMVRCQPFYVRETSVNEPVTLPCTCPGNSPVVQWTRFIPIDAPIANCQRQPCQVKKDYRERFEVSRDTSEGNYSMRISEAAYNDGGSYRCTCNGDKVTEVKLSVYVATVVNAFEGKNVTLPCYGDTRRDAKDAQWKKDGEMLLEFPAVITHDASGGRFAMSEEGFKRGDLSLNITQVQLSDAGFYRCLIQGESRDGVPGAVLLKVEKDQPYPTSCSHGQLALGLVLGLALGLALFAVKWIINYVRTPRQPRDVPHSNVGSPVQQQDPMIPKISSAQPFHD